MTHHDDDTTIARDAGSGKFVTEDYAAAHPDTTVHQTITGLHTGTRDLLEQLLATLISERQRLADNAIDLGKSFTMVRRAATKVDGQIADISRDLGAQPDTPIHPPVVVVDESPLTLAAVRQFVEATAGHPDSAVVTVAWIDAATDDAEDAVELSTGGRS